MLTADYIAAYGGSAAMRDADHIFVYPHRLLRPYLSGYMVSRPSAIPATQVIIPSASATLVYVLGGGSVYGGLRGVNTKPVDIAGYARQFDLLVLIEFHPSGLYPFTGIGQDALLDSSFPFSDIDTALDKQITQAIMVSPSIEALCLALDGIWLHKLDTDTAHPALSDALSRLALAGGQISSKALAQSVHYSERQLVRLFRHHVGTGIKTYGRLLRMRKALWMLESGTAPLSQIAQDTGYFDEPHLLHDLQHICGITPQAYRQNLSLFYNDPFKP